MSLRVLQPGLYTLVVDLGRPNYRSLGVPLGGAADCASLALGNALLGNSPDAPALEICLDGPTVQADVTLAAVVYGAPFLVTHISDAGREKPGFREILPGRTFTLAAGDQLHIGGTRSGMRAYLCVAGGLQTEGILESRSGLAPLQAGVTLPCAAGTTRTRFLPAFVPKTPADRRHPPRDERTLPSDDLYAPFNLPGPLVWPLRVLDGAQASWFQDQEFFSEERTVSSSSNRMGLRLQGRPLTWPGRELISEPVCPGAVQVTRDGQCIILGVDGQTIGGYPKIAQVIQADLDHLGQLRPGDRVRFLRVSLDDATTLYRRRQAELRNWLTRLKVTAE